jgi:DNA-binding response OmpR family regulator
MAKSKEIKILIIEDDLFLLGMYATKFELEGLTVFTADTGEKGLTISSKEKPDVILLDIILPGIDGFEVLKALKSDKNTKNIPVILLTNLSQKNEVERGLSLGAVDYLIKAHFMPSEVVDKIKKIIKK